MMRSPTLFVQALLVRARAMGAARVGVSILARTAIVAVLAMATPTALGQGCSPQLILPPDGDPTLTNFGAAVTLRGDTLVVGEKGASGTAGTLVGAVHVYRWSAASSTFVFETTLTPSDGLAGDTFGTDVAIVGDTILVGAPFRDGSQLNQGRVYVFNRTSSGWSEVQKIDPPAGDARQSLWMGQSLAASGTTVLVGTSNGSGTSSKVYVYDRPVGATSFTRTTTLVPSDGTTAGDEFGRGIAIDGNTAIVGAYFSDPGGLTNAGAAYVFVRSGTSWTQQAKLVATDRLAFDWFGYAVSISGDTVVIGATKRDESSVTNTGCAYAFVRSGTVWSQQTKFVAPLPLAMNEEFGAAVSVSGDRAVIGAPNRASLSGQALTYTRAGTVWSLETTFSGLTPTTYLATDVELGNPVGSGIGAGATLVIGAADQSGALPETVEVHHRVGSSWTGGAAAAPTVSGTTVVMPPCFGQPASITVNATSANPIAYRWQRETSPGSGVYADVFDGPVAGSATVLSGAGSRTLSFTLVDASSAGSYRCRVMGSCGSATATATATPGTTSSASVQGGSLFCTGSNIQLFISATGPSFTGYVWRRNGVPLINDGRISGANSNTLSIINATTGDTGNYDCLATNSCGTIDTADKAVTVGGLVQNPASLSLCGGATASFSVSVTGFPSVAYAWRKNGVVMDAIANPTVATSTLVLTNVRASDAGTYSCSYTATGGCSETSATATLRVCDVDINCSGTVSIQDIFDFLNAWFAATPSADFNGVNGITLQDVFDFLNAWFAGCP